MTPTAKLRFVIRYEPTPIRILQQWCEDREKTIGASRTENGPMVKHHPGEWRDVPLEEEQA